MPRKNSQEPAHVARCKAVQGTRLAGDGHRYEALCARTVGDLGEHRCTRFGREVGREKSAAPRAWGPAMVRPFATCPEFHGG